MATAVIKIIKWRTLQATKGEEELQPSVEHV